jgi:hypothetical protein
MPALPKHFESSAVGASIATEWKVQLDKGTAPSLQTALVSLYGKKIAIGSVIAVVQGLISTVR